MTRLFYSGGLNWRPDRVRCDETGPRSVTAVGPRGGLLAASTGLTGSRNAGLRRLPKSIVNDVSPWARTSYGPSYRGVRGGRCQSRRIKTCSLVARVAGTDDGLVPCGTGGRGANPRTVSRSRGRNCPVSCDSWLRGRKSPGTVSGAPHTSSTEEHSRSSLGAARIPSRTQGSSSSQFGPVRRAIRADLRCRWNRSTTPLACWWYVEAEFIRVPYNCVCRAIAKLLADNYTTLYFKPLCTRVYFNSGRKSHPFFLSRISTSQHKWCEELLWSPGFELVARWQHNTTIDYITNWILNSVKADHNSEVNWDPLSEVRSIGIPNMAIQWNARDFTQVVVCLRIYQWDCFR